MKYILILIIIIFSINAQCQTHLINFSFSTFQTKIINAGHLNSLINQQSISTSINVYKNVCVDFSFSKWNSKSLGLVTPDYISYGYPEDTSQLINWKFWQKKYKFIDLIASYKLNITKKTSLYFGAGPSFAYGTDNFIYQYYLNPSPPSDLLIWVTDTKNEQLGVVAKLNPNYYFLKKRINVGLVVQYRYYPNTLSQREFGITLGYNFCKKRL